VIITGGGRGLGRVIAETLARTYDVLVVGRTETDLQSLCSELQSEGNKAEYVVGDVAAYETADAAVAKIKALGWQLSYLVCNAGIGKSRVTHEITTEEWQQVIDTNLNGSFYFSRAVLPYFVDQKSGVICFISSIAGVKGYAHEAAYVASKHAVVGLSKSIALEYGKHGITSIALCPNFVEGEMTDRTISGLATRRNVTRQEARDVIERKNPQRRIITPEEVAEMVAMICSNRVPSLSGSPIVMGGEL
jgi:NAD(P)-dependent dehydrogenase (short-subunit alcohol dehydrogenase family)